METSVNIRPVAERLLASFPPAEGVGELFRTLLGELAKGSPVSREALAAVLGWPAGRLIVGYGLTLRETPHVFKINGQRLFTWCALDALMFPALIGKTARVLSSCAATGAPVSLTVAPDGVRNVEPAGARVSLVMREPSADIRGSFCCQVNFFASASAANKWVSRHRGVAVVSVEDAFLLGQELVRQLYGARSQEPKSSPQKRRKVPAPAK